MHVIFVLICTSCIDENRLYTYIAVRGGLIEQFPMKLRIPLHGLTREKKEHDMRDNYIHAHRKASIVQAYTDLFFCFVQTNEINGCNNEKQKQNTTKKQRRRRQISADLTSEIKSRFLSINTHFKIIINSNRCECGATSASATKITMIKHFY